MSWYRVSIGEFRFVESGFWSGFWSLVQELSAAPAELNRRQPNSEPETRNQRPETVSYSYRSATIGSTLAARRAGTKHARIPTAVKPKPTNTNVSGSVAVT